MPFVEFFREETALARAAPVRRHEGGRAPVVDPVEHRMRAVAHPGVFPPPGVSAVLLRERLVVQTRMREAKVGPRPPALRLRIAHADGREVGDLVVHRVVAAHAAAVEDRLHLAREAEAVLCGRQRGAGDRVMLHAVVGRVVERLVAAHAARHLAGLQHGPAAHRLHHAPLLVQQLQIERRARGQVHRHRSVLRHGHFPEHLLHEPRAVAESGRRGVHRESARTAHHAAADAGGTVRERHHAHRLDRAARNALHRLAAIDVGDGDRAGLERFVGTHRAAGRKFARAHGDGTSARDFSVLRHQHFARSVHVGPHETEVAVGRHALRAPQARDHHALLVHRIREAVDRALLPEIAVALHELGAPKRRQLPAAGSLLASLARIEPHELARFPRVVSRAEREEERTARRHARLQDAVREIGVAAVERALVGAVGVHREDRLRVDLAAVVVLPAHVEHAPVVRERGEVVVHLVVGDARNLGTVRLAAVEVEHLVPPAVHDLPAARGVEEDAPVRQETALDVGRAETKRELFDLARREVHRVEVEVVTPVARLERKQQALPVGRNVHVAVAARLRREERRLLPKSVRLVFGKAERRPDRAVRTLLEGVGKFGEMQERTAASQYVVTAIRPRLRHRRHRLQAFRSARELFGPPGGMRHVGRDRTVLCNPDGLHFIHRPLGPRAGERRHAHQANDAACHPAHQMAASLRLNEPLPAHGRPLYFQTAFSTTERTFIDSSCASRR